MCECTHMTTFAVLVDTSKESGKEIDVSKPKEKPVEKPITEEPATDSEKENKPPSDNDKENKVTSDGDKAEIDKEKEKVKEEKPEMEEPSSKPLENEPPAVEEEPATTKPTDTSAATAAFIYTTTLPPQYTKQKLTKENFFKSKWFWILLLALLLLLLLLLICLLCCCCWRRRKKKQVSEETVEQKDIGSVSSGPDTLQTTEHIIDKSREKLDPKKGPVTPGSTVSSRTTSPEPGQSPGWRKFMSHAQHPKQILLKEKALLFKDYVQPYHFLSEKEPPNTSVESIYGSTVTSYPQTGASDVSSGKVLSPKRKRNYEPKHRRERVAPVLKERLEEKSVNSDNSDFTPEKKTNTINEKPKSLNVNKPVQVKKQPVNDKVKATEVIASQMTEATSMEWDPYLESKQKLNKKNGPSPPRRKRNISPISEEDEDLANSKPSQDVSKTTAGQDNSRAQSDNQDSPVSSETSYMESVSGSTKTGNESSEASSPYIRKNTAVRIKDNDSSESRSSFVPAERKRSVTSTTTSDSSESDSPVLRRQPRHYQERKYADKSSSPLTGKRQDKNTSTSDMLSPHERRRERSPHLLDKNRDSKNANNR